MQKCGQPIVYWALIAHYIAVFFFFFFKYRVYYRQQNKCYPQTCQIIGKTAVNSTTL